MTGKVEDTLKELDGIAGRWEYMAIMLVFCVPVLLIGWWSIRDSPYMIMPIMFVLTYGMMSINRRLKQDDSVKTIYKEKM